MQILWHRCAAILVNSLNANASPLAHSSTLSVMVRSWLLLQCYENGASAFVTEVSVDHDMPEDVPVIMVPSTLVVLGELAAAFLDQCVSVPVLSPCLADHKTQDSNSSKPLTLKFLECRHPSAPGMIVTLHFASPYFQTLSPAAVSTH